MEQVEAGVLGTIYRNDENGYTVLSARVGRREITIVGTLPEMSPGEQAVFSGEWVEHPSYGRQLRCTACTPQLPTTKLGIERYLGGGLIRGVGPSTAKMIVEHFGEETLTVLSEHPERLQELPKMGKKRWIRIAEAYREQAGAREAMVFLQTYGIPTSLAGKISKLYGDRTADLIRQNPYRLCEDIDGVGFLTADRIGTALGIAPDSDGRIVAALKYILRDAAGSMGHVYLPRQELIARAAQLLRVEEALVERQVVELILQHDLVCLTANGEERVYPPVLQTTIIEHSQFFRYNKWHDATLQTLPKDEKPSHSTISVLKRMYAFKLHVKIKNVVERDVFVCVVFGKQRFHSFMHVVRLYGFFSANFVCQPLVVAHGKPRLLAVGCVVFQN